MLGRATIPSGKKCKAETTARTIASSQEPRSYVPANLTPQFRRAEQRFRDAKSVAQQVSALEEMLREIPKHKGTEKLQAEIKSRLSKLRVVEQEPSSKRVRVKTDTLPPHVIGPVLVVGLPNAGKSRLFNRLTSSNSLVAEYPFTTLQPHSAIASYQDIGFQLLDMPASLAESPDTIPLDATRSAAMVLIVIDSTCRSTDEQTFQLIEQFQNSKSRLGKRTGYDEQIRGVTLTAAIAVYTKCDCQRQVSRRSTARKLAALDIPSIEISAETGEGCDALLSAIFMQSLAIRVYAKSLKKGKGDPKNNLPILIKQGDNLTHFALQIHQDLAKRFQSAKIWRVGEVTPMVVHREFQPRDGDIVQLLNQ